MNNNRLADLLEHIRQAASDACVFTDRMVYNDFIIDKRTQQAVIMSLIIIGEAATKIMDDYPEFTNRQNTIPLRSMRGMRNRIAHGYFNIDLAVVWETVKTALPELLENLASLQNDSE